MRYNLFASKRYCLYNRTAKTTVQLQNLEKRKSNKEPIVFFTIEKTMDDITLMTVKEMKMISKKSVNSTKTL